MNIEQQLVTPEMAKEYLKANTKNRKVDRFRVNHYAHLLKSGQFMSNGDTIRFDWNGVLIDGQHRLMAIAKTGIAATFIVVKGLNPETFKTIDMGKLRSNSDIFAIEGIKNSTNISSGIGRYLKLMKGMNGSRRANAVEDSITITDIVEEYNKNPEAWQNLYSYAIKTSKEAHASISPAAIIAYTSYFSAKTTSEKANDFFTDYVNNKGIAGMLYQKLIFNKISKKKLTTSEIHGLIMKAFYYYAKNKEVKILRVTTDEDLPKF
jgi:hypothetical protein